MKKIRPSQKRRTQIVCTIGPACRSPEKIAALIQAGMTVARLHFSYASQNEHAENIRRLRAVSRKLRQPIKILQDLTGAKTRLGEFARGSVKLKKDATFTLTSRPVKGNARIVSVTLPEMISAARAGDLVLLNDGALKLRVRSRTQTDLRCNVELDGRVKSGNAVHLPGRTIRAQVPTAKDLEDVRFGIEKGVDWIGLSYATSVNEVQTLRRFIRQNGSTIPIVVKIERRAALDRLKELVRASDIIMVARGDLGMEIPLEQIGLAQKRIIARAKLAGKPVITATEMLFSMMDKPRPTRAEITDVTNAILDGSGGVMLSGESAMGHFPIEATRMLTSIAAAVEAAQKNPG